MSITPPLDRILDEALVRPYELPPLLRTGSGEQADQVSEWEGGRRSELLELFRTQIYGTPPPTLPFRVLHHETGEALDGMAIREQVSLLFSADVKIDLLIYRPARATEPVPVFLGMNYYGNHSVIADPMVSTETSSLRQKKPGEAASRWPLQHLVKQGFAVVTFCYEDVAPDDAACWRNGAARLVNPTASGSPGATEAGAIAWWAWGTSRAVDYLLMSPDTYRPDCIMLVGQSRHGKAALWAGAEDPRFAAVFSNCSGCTGAALAKRKFGETVAILNTARPHWFCGNYKQYNDREEALPVDQHQLVALMAPRPVYIASATEDLSADPLGEYLSAYHAQEIYEAYEYPPLLQDAPPEPDRSVGGRIGYHLRSGEHDITANDWLHFFRFAQKNFGLRPSDEV